jgi:hypothetical protein
MEEQQPRPERWWQGGALSLLLHALLALAAALLVWRPAPEQAPLSALLVDIISMPNARPGQGATPGSGPTESPLPPPRTRQTAGATPRTKGVRPKGVTPSDDPMTARLHALSRLHQPGDATGHAITTGDTGNGSGQGAYTLKDFVRAQILRRWLPDFSLPGARGMSVSLRIRLSANGAITNVVMMDTARMQTDAAFRDMALSARDAAILSSPLHLPPGHYPQSQALTIELNPEAVLK